MEVFIGREIKKTHNLLHRLFDAKMKVDSEEDLTFMDRQICRYLFENSNRFVYQRDIEKKFSIRRSSASTQLGKMQSKGLIERYGDNNDKRLKRIVLTDKAKESLTSSLKVLQKTEAQVVEGLSEEEKDCFLKTLDKIQQNILGLLES